jgi:hypothetical protein
LRICTRSFFAVAEIQVFLLLVAGEGDIPGRAGAECSGFDERLFDERAIGLEHLDAVVAPVAHIE